MFHNGKWTSGDSLVLALIVFALGFTSCGKAWFTHLENQKKSGEDQVRQQKIISPPIYSNGGLIR